MEKLKLLLVDDSKEILDEFSKIFGLIQGIEIVGKARSEDEALHLFTTLQPDMVCLDIRLQQGNGLDILHRIKKDKPDTIVFMITNYPYNGLHKKCLELGAEFFFDKSRDIQKVVQIIEELSHCGSSRIFKEVHK
jgi:DNA-binding NarL/FixJ family response regulator